MAEKLHGLTIAQVARIGAVVKAVEQQPSAGGRDPATWRPFGATPIRLAVLTADVGRELTGESIPGTAAFWGAPDPDSDTSEEASLGEDEVDVFPWILEPGWKIPSGSRVLVAWIAGRWYLIDALDCAEEV